MLRLLGHLVATCCEVLVAAGAHLKMVKFFTHYLRMLHDVVVVWPGRCNNVETRRTHLFDCRRYYYVRRRNKVAKRVQNVALNNVRIC